MSTTVEINGAEGEGGGQVLRTSLALSAMTGQPFTIQGIRAGRKTPGLMRQHLTCVLAVRDICSAQVKGAVVGSTALEFVPSKVYPGTYYWSVGTAGAVTLVLQAVLPPLMMAGGPSHVTIEGGTHTIMSPVWEFLENSLVPVLNDMGAGISVKLERHGFYPNGGGRVHVKVDPEANLRRVSLRERAEVKSVKAKIVMANLPRHIAERQIARIQKELEWEVGEDAIEEIKPSFSACNAVILEARTAQGVHCAASVGDIKTRAEVVAARAIADMQSWQDSTAGVGEHLADQLLTPMTIMGGEFSCAQWSSHAATNVETMRKFGCQVAVREGDNRFDCEVEALTPVAKAP